MCIMIHVDFFLKKDNKPKLLLNYQLKMQPKTANTENKEQI